MARSSLTLSPEVVALVSAARTAFTSDSSYAVQMAKQAHGIRHKRAVWQARLDLRRAEATAVAVCAKADAFVCQNEAPCGSGQCRFADEGLRDLELPVGPGKASRPCPAAEHPTYALEEAVRPLLAMRRSA